MSKSTNFLSAPVNVTLKITNACNLHCLHCHSKSGTNYTYMDMDLFHTIVAQLRESKVFGINISGGEPLMHPDFFTIVQEINRLGMRVTVSSNAVLIDDEIAQKMAENSIPGVHVSLDGSNADIHDKIRNIEGCFCKAVEGMEKLIKNNIEVMVVTVIVNQSPEEYARTIDFAYMLGAKAHKTNALMPIGNAQDNIDRLKSGFLAEYIDIWKSKKKQYKGKMHIKGEMGFLMQMGEEYYYENKQPDIFNVGCSAGLTTCSILEDGKVALCSFSPEIVCGDLKTHGFNYIWTHSDVFQRIRTRDFTGCKDCASVLRCGGCRVRAWNQKDLYGEDPLCWKNRKKGAIS